MEPIEMGQWIATGTAGIRALKELITLIPGGRGKEAQDELSKVETALGIKAAEAASTLGFRLCRREFPPHIMVQNESGQWICPVCGVQADEGPVLSPHESAVLTAIDNSPEFTVQGVMSFLGLTRGDAEHAVQELISKELVIVRGVSMSGMRENRYAISQEGRRFLRS